MNEEGHKAANQAFRRLLDYQTMGANQKELVGVWLGLVRIIHETFPQWVCSGPHKVADGKIVFTGTKNYIMVFDADDQVYVGMMKGVMLTPNFNPNCDKLYSLLNFVKGFKK